MADEPEALDDPLDVTPDGLPIMGRFVDVHLPATKQALLEAIWGGSDYRDPRTIDVHVRHLREKIESDPSEPHYLFTVRGVGYRFREVA